MDTYTYFSPYTYITTGEISNAEVYLSNNESIKELINCQSKINEIKQLVNTYNQQIDQEKSNIEQLFANPEFKQFICDKLNEEITRRGTRLSQNNYIRYIERPMQIVNNGVATTVQTDTTRYEFYPETDNWEYSYYEEKDGKYRIAVECIKNREWLGGAGPYIMDIYYTSWFEI